MRALAVVLTMLGGAAMAAPEVSVRPVARSAAILDELAAFRPVIRPLTDTPRAMVPFLTMDQAAAVAALPRVTSLRPTLRSPEVVRRAMAQREERVRGLVCGDPDLKGDVVGFVPGRISGCGVEDAVLLRSVSGVTLSTPATMDCSTARALKTWTDQSTKPTMRSLGSDLISYQVAAGYACRTRNNQPGARISEHGKGKAIDISGFILRDGRKLTVGRDWSSPNKSAMRRIHREACGPFGTVLGPNSDRFHQNHFHLDTASHRGGPFCR